MSSTHRTVAEIEVELREARAREAAEQKARVDAVQPIYRFTLFETEPDRIHPIFDDTVRVFTLRGEVLNKEELAAVGRHTPLEGTMKYLYNGMTTKFICAVGGGTYFIRTAEAFEALAKVVNQYPLGFPTVDITNLVNQHRKYA